MMTSGADAARSLGFQLIESSALQKGSKYQYSCGWRWWTAFFADEDLSPLAASADDALRWQESDYGKPASRIKTVRKAVAFVYQAVGLTSPMHIPRVLRANGEGEDWYKAPEDLCEEIFATYELRVQDYIAWCNCNGVPALPGSPQRVGEFLLSLCDELGLRAIRIASTAVSRYIESNGHPPTGRHPVVLAAMAECEARLGPIRGGAPAARSLPTGKHARHYHRQWTEWCAAQSIEWEHASGADALRYLRALEHQRDASFRVAPLSRFYLSIPDPFSTDEIIKWKEWHRAARKEGDLPAPASSRAAEIVAELRTARSTFEGPLPVGLTLEEVEAVSDNLGFRVSDATLATYAEAMAQFEAWLSARGVAVWDVSGMHVSVYLRERAEGRRLSTVSADLAALSTIFDLMGYELNPAHSAVVTDTMGRLRAERPEAPKQALGFRKEHFDAVVANAYRSLPRESAGQTELRALGELSLFGLTFDGLLRRKEIAAARWVDLKTTPNGNGTLDVPFSKTTKFGDGDPTFVSGWTMERLRNFRQLRRSMRCEKPGDPRIFQRSPETLGERIKAVCKAAGLEDGFTSHSLRIGMAQELAVAGFGMPLIMLAGRWKKPEMVYYYIRNLKVDESAVALLHQMRADGRFRLSHETRGIDVLSTYQHVRETIY